MQEVFVAMAIMGCGDAGTACETLEIVEASFSSMAECQQAAPEVLYSLTDLDFPEIEIQCMPRLQVAERAGQRVQS